MKGSAFLSMWWLFIYAKILNGQDLEMYVDELPEMPKIYGYSRGYGVPRPINLTFGMYVKKWVCTVFYYFLLVLYNSRI